MEESITTKSAATSRRSMRRKHRKNKKNKGYSPQEYIRVSIHSLANVLEEIANDENASMRLRTYTKGTDCVVCGLKGAFFASERQSLQATSKYHYNLYGYNEKGEEVMMTSDHIIPKSKGGVNGLKNRQPMCYPCNQAKADKHEA